MNTKVVVITTGACSALFVNGEQVLTSVRAEEPVNAGRSIAKALGVELSQFDSEADKAPHSWPALYAKLTAS